jgi:hypothetical protein
MNLGDIFKGLKLDQWYKILMAVGAVGFAVALTMDVKAMTNSQLALLSGGFFLVGLGIWKGETTETDILPPNVYRGGMALKVKVTYWSAEPIGCFFDLVGVALIVLFVVSLIRPPQPTSTTPTSPAVATSMATASAQPTAIASSTP